MKKTVLSFMLMNLAFIMHAQIPNANLDSWTNSNPNSWIFDYGGQTGVKEGTNNYLTSYGEALTTTQIAGATGGSGALLTTVNATSTTLINAGVPIIPGQLLGEWNYTGANLYSVSYYYDGRPLAGDTSLIQVSLYNFGGQLISYALDYILPSEATTGWTQKTMTFVDNGNAGPITKVEIWCQSSIRGAGGSYTAGSTLKVDNFVLNEGTASIEENSALNIQVYPNPANEIITINANLDIESIAIISLDGKTLKTQSGNGALQEVNISDLKSGTYIYEVTTVNGFVSRKTFVKN